MKIILKYITGAFFLPFLALAAIIAVLKTIFVSTIVFSWEKGDEWHGDILCGLNDFMKWLKK